MSEWRFERVGWHPEDPENVLVVEQGDEAKVRGRYETLCRLWDEGWSSSHGLARLVSPDGEVVAERAAPPQPDQDRIQLFSMLEHVIERPKMYFGTLDAGGQKADSVIALELAAFLNGYMAHRSGMMMGSFSFGCQADPTKTLEENARAFKAAILKWDESKPGTWRCCVDAP